MDKIDEKVLGIKPITEMSDSEVLQKILGNSRKTNSHLGTIKGILVFFLVITILGALISLFSVLSVS